MLCSQLFHHHTEKAGHDSVSAAVDNPGRWNIVTWPLTFLDPQMELALYQPFGTYNFEVVPRIEIFVDT